MLLSNQECMTQPTPINFYPNEYSQEFHYYYPFAVKLNRCVGSCNNLSDLTNKVCVPMKTEDLNISLLNMITGINESKTSKKDISCECKCNFDGKNIIQSIAAIMINVDVSAKNVTHVKKILLILLHVIVKMEKIQQVLWMIC